MATKVTAHVRIRIPHGDDFAIGPGKATLLEAILSTGSISAAARQLDMSYRRAWILVDAMNQSFIQPLVETAKGGASGGGARVTAFGVDVLARFRHMEATAVAAVAPEVRELARLLAPPPR